MSKIVIADDEAIMRKYLTTIIERDLDGFELCAVAKNGFEALQMIETWQPDLAIIDIDMPEKDGVEVLRELKEKQLSPNTKVVVLSCYNDFDYVKDAMRYGAVDYLLKHKVDAETLVKTLELVFVNGQPVHVVKRKKMKQPKRFSGRQDQLLEAMLLSNRGNVDLDDSASVLDILSENILIAVGMMDYHDKFITYNSEDVIRQMNNSIIAIIQRYLPGSSHSLTACIEEDKYLIVCSFALHTGANEIMRYANDKLLSIGEQVEKELHITITFGVSELCGNIASLAAYYTQALQALKYKLYVGINRIIWYPTCKLTHELPHELHEEITNWSKMLFTSSRAEKQLDKVFNMIETNRLAYSQYDFLLIRMVGAMLNGVENPSQLDKTFGEFDSAITFFGCETYKDHKAWFSKRLEILHERGKEYRYRREICNALQYIEEHLDEELSLTVIAAHVNFSKTYFSQLFKQSTGENLVDYIARHRIDRAKELLVNPNYKIYEVAARVGFENQHYFNRLFKSMMGITPTEYRFKQCFE